MSSDAAAEHQPVGRGHVFGQRIALGIEAMQLFVAGEAIGGYQEVAQADVTGDLKRKVFGA